MRVRKKTDRQKEIEGQKDTQTTVKRLDKWTNRRTDRERDRLSTSNSSNSGLSIKRRLS